jgi:hypothetical protein
MKDVKVLLERERPHLSVDITDDEFGRTTNRYGTVARRRWGMTADAIAEGAALLSNLPGAAWDADKRQIVLFAPEQEEIATGISIPTPRVADLIARSEHAQKAEQAALAAATAASTFTERRNRRAERRNAKRTTERRNTDNALTTQKRQDNQSPTI